MSPRKKPPQGFTLVELLVAATLAAAVMAAVLSAFVFLARNFTRMANFQALEQQGRTALTYLQADLAEATAVKKGTTPTAATLTLALPGGDVTYTYDSTNERLRRQATFGSSPDLYLLNTPGCRCTDFSFSYYTGENGSPVDQATSATNMPLSVKQLQVRFSLETAVNENGQTRMTYAVASPRWHFRNKRKPDGS